MIPNPSTERSSAPLHGESAATRDGTSTTVATPRLPNAATLAASGNVDASARIWAWLTELNPLSPLVITGQPSVLQNIRW